MFPQCFFFKLLLVHRASLSHEMFVKLVEFLLRRSTFRITKIEIASEEAFLILFYLEVYFVKTF